MWHFFAFRDSFSTRNGSPSFARACFYIKLLHIFLKILVFRCIATCTEQELFRVITTSCSIYSEKCKYEFSNIKFCFWLFLSTRVLQGMSKNQKTNQSNQKTSQCWNLSDTETCTSSKTYRGENVIGQSQKARKTNFKLQLLASKCVFCKIITISLSSIIVILILKFLLNSK